MEWKISQKMQTEEGKAESDTVASFIKHYVDEKKKSN